MLKRNKLSIFLCLLVVGLTIYYIKAPKSEKKPTETVVTSVNRYPLYAEARMNILNKRNEEIKKYESEEISVSSVNYVDELMNMTIREVAMEKQIKNLGFSDCLVLAEDKKINVNVLADSFSKEEFINVALILKEEFGEEFIIKVNVDKKI